MDSEADEVWRALADPTRRRILDLLRDGPRTTGQLDGAIAGLSRYAVMKHLGVLERARLVVVRREGRRRWNHLNAVPLRRVYERWVSGFEDRWAGGLERLRERVETSAGPATAPPSTKGKEHEMATKLSERPCRVAHVEVETTIAAAAERVFDAFFEDTAEWFYESEETKRTRPARIERRVGGRFYIALEDGGENMLAFVTMIKPNREVRLRGDCTIPQAFVANMTVKFEAVAGGTRVGVSHRMAGEFDDDLPAGFDEGWTDGLAKLKALVEGGGDAERRG